MKRLRMKRALRLFSLVPLVCNLVLTSVPIDPFYKSKISSDMRFVLHKKNIILQRSVTISYFGCLCPAEPLSFILASGLFWHTSWLPTPTLPHHPSQLPLFNLHPHRMRRPWCAFIKRLCHCHPPTLWNGFAMRWKNSFGKILPTPTQCPFLVLRFEVMKNCIHDSFRKHQFRQSNLKAFLDARNSMQY